MELLNISPVAILPRTMWLVFRTLASSSGLTRREVVDAVCPPTMMDETPSSGAHVGRALDTLVKFDLVRIEDASGSHDAMLFAEGAESAAAFSRLLRQALLHRTSHSEGPPEDLLRGIVWLLSQSPNIALTRLQADSDVPGLFTNDTRWNTFTYWAKFLGFGQEWPLENGGLSVDPTSAVADAVRSLPNYEFPSAAIEIHQFLRHLEKVLPVLSVEAVSDRGTVSQALGFALRALAFRGLIGLERKADAPSAVSIPASPGQTEDSLISHVTVGRTA